MNDATPLDALEARVLGVLIEKELTTPDQYPLSINALASGCNQKSNRDPVLSLAEREVRAALEGLRLKQLAGAVQSSGARVERFRHNARETWGVSQGALAILAELLLRGAQAPGDLRARASRLVELPDQAALTAHLDELFARGYAARLAPLPGSRAPRYDQLLANRSRLPGSRAAAAADEQPAAPAESPTPSAAPVAAAPAPQAAPAPAPTAAAATGSSDPALEERVEALERQVAELTRQLHELARQLGAEL